MARNTKKGNSPKTRTVSTTYTGFDIECTVKEWAENDTVDITVSLGKQEIFVIYGCRIIEGKKGNFLGFPSRAGNDGNYYAYARILDDGMCDAILDAIEE